MSHSPSDRPDIWTLLERSVSRVPDSPPQAESPRTVTQTRRTSPKLVPPNAFVVLASAFWVYALLKVFVVDLDRAVLTALLPAALPILGFRSLIYLAILAVVVWKIRRWWLYLVLLTFFPIFVLVRCAVALFRRRSWPLFLAIIQTATSIGADIRYHLISKSLAIIAAVLIVISDDDPVVLASTALVVALVGLAVLRRVTRTFRSPTFVTMQLDMIRRLLHSNLLDRLLRLDDDLIASGIERYTENQVTRATTIIGTRIFVNKFLQLWALKIDEYRREQNPALVFNLLSYGTLLAATVAGLALLDLATIKVAHQEFSSPQSPALIAVLVYAASTLTLGSAGGIQPIGDIALGLQLAGFIAGLLIGGSFVLTTIVAYLRERDDTAAKWLSSDLRDEATKLEERFRTDFVLSIDEAYQQLVQMRAAIVYLLAFFVNALPASSESDEE